MAAANAAQSGVLSNRAEAVQAIGEKEQAAIGDLSVQRQLNAAELAEKQEQNRKLHAELEADDARNLKVATEAKIPDFWQGRQGQLVGSALAIALSGAGAGLLGSNQNTALAAVNHNVDQYFTREKEKIDGLFKAASAKRQINDSTRHRYAQELLDLKDQHTMVLESVLDRVKQVAAEAKTAADVSAVQFLQAQLGEKIVKDRMEIRQLRADLKLKAAQTNAANANAAESRANIALKKAQAQDPNGGKAPTEGQNKLGAFAGEGLGALNVLAQHGMPSPSSIHQFNTNQRILNGADEAKGISGAVSNWVGQKAGYIPKSPYEGIPEKDQQGIRAFEQMIESVARIHSGGAVPNQEQYRFARQMMPQPGDSPALVQQKLNDAKAFVETNLKLAGGAGQIAAGVNRQVAGPGPAQQPQQSRPVTMKGPDGSFYVLGPDGMYRKQ